MNRLCPVLEGPAPLPWKDLAGAAIGSRQVTLAGVDYTFEPVMAGLVVVLVQIESPFMEFVRILSENIDGMRKATSDHAALKFFKKIDRQFKREVRKAPESAMETVFAFVTPLEKCQWLLRDGHPRFAAEARNRLGMVHPMALDVLEQIAMQRFMLAIASGSLTVPEEVNFN